MSVILYVLGAGLITWSGFMLLTGDAFATVDIAATLAGAGVLSVGMGAVVGAIARLGRVIGAAALEAGRRPPYGAQPKIAVQRAAQPASAAAPVVAPPIAGPSVDEAPLVNLDLDAPAPRPAAPFARSPFAPRPSQPPRPVVAAHDAAAPARVGFEPPRIVAPALGGLSLRRAAEAAPSFIRPPERIEPQLSRAPTSAAPSDATRPDAGLPRAAAWPHDEPDPPEALDAERPSEPAPEAEPDVVQETPEPAAYPPPEHPEPEAFPPEPEAAAEIEPEPIPGPAPAQAPAVRVSSEPDWLVRARARRAARARGDEAGPSTIPAERPAAVPQQTAPADLDAADADDAAPVEVEPAGPTPEAAAPDPSSTVVREGELNGVTYRFFEDGSVEAASGYGVRRFPSVDALRDTVRAARGDAGAITDDEHVPDPAQPGSETDGDPLDAAIAQLESGGAARSAG